MALAAAVDSVERVELIEPSEALLAIALEAFAGSGKAVRGYAESAEVFLAQLGPVPRWDVVQSTFAMHTMPSGERASILAAIAQRTGRLMIAEFDVPEFGDRTVEHATYAALRYELGLREYAGDELVTHGFLLPVLVGQFDPAHVRHTFEQSAGRWVDQLTAAGFTTVEVAPLVPYWWADAIVLEASRSTDSPAAEPQVVEHRRTRSNHPRQENERLPTSTRAHHPRPPW